MTQQRWLPGLLLMVALCVWAWNGYRLMQVSGVPGFEDEGAIPELAVDLPVDVPETKLPELVHDPFANESPGNNSPGNRAPAGKAAPPRKPKPPTGVLRLIIQREDQWEAVWVDGRGKSGSLKQGSTVDEWTVKVITLQGVEWTHPTGEFHVWSLL